MKQAVLIERRGHVMIVTINRPEVRNCVNAAVHDGVGTALEQAEHDPEIRAVIITGAGEMAFCAGGDLKSLSRGENLQPDDPAKQAWGSAGIIHHHISKPLIAAINGFALGLGTEIVLACDLAVAADSAKLGLPEVKRGLWAGDGGALRLPRQIPLKIAMEILLTGEPITATRALEIGLVNAVVPQDEVLDAALSLAARITCNAPLSVQATKRIARGIADLRIAGEGDAWAINAREGEMLFASEDAHEGPLAFAEKRPPTWKAC